MFSCKRPQNLKDKHPLLFPPPLSLFSLQVEVKKAEPRFSAGYTGQTTQYGGPSAVASNYAGMNICVTRGVGEFIDGPASCSCWFCVAVLQ